MISQTTENRLNSLREDLLEDSSELGFFHVITNLLTIIEELNERIGELE